MTIRINETYRFENKLYKGLHIVRLTGATAMATCIEPDGTYRVYMLASHNLTKLRQVAYDFRNMLVEQNLYKMIE